MYQHGASGKQCFNSLHNESDDTNVFCVVKSQGSLTLLTSALKGRQRMWMRNGMRKPIIRGLTVGFSQFK